MSNEKITDPQEQVAEGDRFYNGEGVEKDFEQAVAWYKKAAEQGYAQGQYYLGYCYYEGEGVEQDYAQAAALYSKAAQQGNAAAQQKLGFCYCAGEGVDQDFEKAFYWYTQSAQQGRAYAQYLLGACYYNGEGVEKDFSQAVHWFTKAADQNDDTAQCMLGLCFYFGTGADMDYKQAAYWLEKSAQQGNSDAQFYLGDCYLQGEGVQEDHAKAAYWYEKSAQQDHKVAQFKLAYRYLEGDGVECDTEKAVYWYTKSAEQGYDRAQYSLGVYYNDGESAEQDKEKAVYWFTKAAQQGYADSCVELAIMYLEGKGVENDFEKGIYWFREAAKSGEPGPMLNFGQWLLSEANGAQDDIIEGLQWIEKAADGNEHNEDEILWQARWVLAEIYEYGFFQIAKDLEKAKRFYELLAENGDNTADVYFKLLSNGKEDANSSRGWSDKNLVVKVLSESFPDFDVSGALYEKAPDYSDTVFTDAQREECLPIAEKMLELADIAKRESILAFAGIAENEEDVYLKTALKIAADGIRADLFTQLMVVLFIKDRPSGAALLKRLIVLHGIFAIIKGDFTVLKLKVLIGSLYVPKILAPKNAERKYKMTFNYLLTHREIPRQYFADLNTFYDKVLPDPEMMQRFLTFAHGRCVYFANENPDIEPPFEAETFDMVLFGEKERRVLVITLPKCDTPPESYQIAIPILRQKAAYYTCELSVDPLTDIPCFIFGEWNAEQKHSNYGKIEMKSENSFAEMAAEIAYGKILKEPPFERNNMKFDTPTLELYCEKCGNNNFFYEDNDPPFHCDNCGAALMEEI